MVRIRILLVDDHEVIRRNIRRLLTAHDDFDLFAEASNGTDAIEMAREHQPDVILLDISMPEPNGLAALPLIRKVAPNARVLMITSHDAANFARAALDAGARGFLTKSDLSAELALAIRQVYGNETFVSEKLNLESNDKPNVPSADSAEA